MCFVLGSKLKISIFSKLLNEAICHISVVFIIIFNSEKGWKDTKSYRKIKLADVWTELNTNFFFSDNIFKDFCGAHLRNQVK